MLAAAWNCPLVPVGVVAVHESVVQVTLAPDTGFESFNEDTNVPGVEYPDCI